MKSLAILKESGNIVEVEYDDDDLYICKSIDGNGSGWYYSNEFEFLSETVIKKLQLENYL